MRDLSHEDLTTFAAVLEEVSKDDELSQHLLTSLDDANRWAMVRLLLKPEERGDILACLDTVRGTLAPKEKAILQAMIDHLQG